ncbi:MAG: carbon storage regulator CsrA [Planctomycetaceae bacterium]
MLVLSRKLDESIKIGNDIKITILRIKGNTIRIGIDAPSDVRVIRSELKAMAEEGSAADLDDTSSTVTAIVDSPAVASTRLFVGKVSRGEEEATLQSVLSEVDSVVSEATLPLRIEDQAAPLRAFVTGGRGLTAV